MASESEESEGKTTMPCSHHADYVAQLAYSAPSTSDTDSDRRRANGLQTWIDGARLEGIEAEFLEIGDPRQDRADTTHCGTIEIAGCYWDVYLARRGATTTTRTRWEHTAEGGLPVDVETLTVEAPYLHAIQQHAEPLGEHIRLAVAQAAEPRLLSARDGYLVERCARAALEADRRERAAD